MMCVYADPSELCSEPAAAPVNVSNNNNKTKSFFGTEK